MLPGPVFQWELIRTARKPRFFWLRTLYGLILLFLIWQNYAVMSLALSSQFGGFELQILSVLGPTMFYMFASVQLLAVVILTPTAFATAIVEERQRRTLHYLLASPLSSGEIVVGKLMAKLLYLGVFLAVGLPVVSLLTLIGGIEPLLIFLVYGGTLTTAFMLGSAGILISTYARKVREAVVGAGGFTFVWLIIPIVISAILPLVTRGTTASEFSSWVLAANEWVAATNPFTLISGFSRGPSFWQPQLAWLIGLQLAYGTAFTLLAVWRLRPVFRRQESRVVGSRWLGKGAWKWRLLRRPPCGDDPILWKERYTSRVSGVAMVATVLLGMVILGALGYTTYLFMWPAITQSSAFSDYESNMFIRAVVTGLYVLGVLAVSSNVAISIPSEREEDTWSSLLATPLSEMEILRGKMVGLVLRFWPVGALIAFYLLLGVVTRVVHPLGAALAVVEMVIFTWFALALGMNCSLRAKTSMKAQRATLGALVVLNGVGTSIVSSVTMSSFGLAMCAPMILAVTMATPSELEHLVTGAGGVLNSELMTRQLVLASVLGVVGYGVLAYVLTGALRSRFIVLADRPRRSKYASTPIFRRSVGQGKSRSSKQEQPAGK
ncbi:MAG TPA: ABC transporter permease subunit [Isosphaeraceae bacterium]|jgi:ABC-type transport system involved in multi-copper enzyme maturation permease subunit|nr:ABC transporter permease subunit [Isosphaeraceae bacterium]